MFSLSFLHLQTSNFNDTGLTDNSNISIVKFVFFATTDNSKFEAPAKYKWQITTCHYFDKLKVTAT